MAGCIFGVIGLLPKFLEYFLYLFFVFAPVEFHLNAFVFGVLALWVVVDVLPEEFVVVGQFAATAVFLFAVGAGEVA